MASIALQRVDKVYPNGHVAVRDLSLDIADGELLVLVGPSGSGKSTVLRLIAGLESLTGGRIVIGDHDVTDTPPQQRDLAMVFQNYALYPHKSVGENLAFGLRVRGTDQAIIDQRVGADGSLARNRGAARPPPGRAVGGPAPARGARPCHRPRAAGVPARRAALESRSAAARGHPRRTGPAAPPPGRDDGLCDARSGRGYDARHADRRDERGRDRAGGGAARHVQPPGDGLRRGVRGVAGDEPVARTPLRRRCGCA